jgi:hypothetical protein
MITRALYRRLERLEEQVTPKGEPTFLQIVIVDSDGTKTLGDRIEMPSPGRRRGAKAAQLWRRTR